MFVIKIQVLCTYINFNQSTTVLLVNIMFIIYNIRATSFGFMPSGFFLYFLVSPSVLEVGIDSWFLTYMSRRIDFS